MPDIHIVPGLWGIDGYSGDLDDDPRPLRRRAGRDVHRVPLRLAPRQPGGGTAAARARRREVACATTAQPRRQARPRRPLDGRARRPLLPRVPRRVAGHPHADHVRDAAPRLAERRSTSSSTGSSRRSARSRSPTSPSCCARSRRSTSCCRSTRASTWATGYERVAETGDRLPGVDPARATSALEDFHRAIEAGIGRPRAGGLRDPLRRRHHPGDQAVGPLGRRPPRDRREPRRRGHRAATARCRGSRRRRSRPTTGNRRTSRCTPPTGTARCRTPTRCRCSSQGILTARAADRVPRRAERPAGGRRAPRRRREPRPAGAARARRT